jgi:hypothetical protein
VCLLASDPGFLLLLHAVHIHAFRYHHISAGRDIDIGQRGFRAVVIDISFWKNIRLKDVIEGAMSAIPHMK